MFRPHILRSCFALLVLVVVTPLSAQIPTKCLEIESILVDACNPSNICPSGAEGQNEMVRFITGPQATALGDITVSWPNNNFQGFVQNAATAAVTSELNATVQSCGILLEPAGGIIPPGSTVLLVTSAQLCAEANPFTNLGDTIYVIYQNGNNMSGHFANSPAAGNAISSTPPGGANFRTLILTYTPTNCTDTAVYQRELLTNNLGSYGGENGESNGGTVQYSWPGVPQATYINFGCSAPIKPTGVVVTANGTLCSGNTVGLTATVSGNYLGGFWSGGAGTFSSATDLATDYTAGIGETGSVTLQYCVVGLCGADSVCATVVVPGGVGPTVAIGADGPLTICPGGSLVLTASGATSYAWDNGETTAAITITQPGTYQVTGTNACGTATESVTIGTTSGPTVLITASATELCPGQTVTLTASGATSFEWSGGDTTASITIDAPGNYSVIGTSNCGSGQESINIQTADAPSITITGDTVVCGGGTVTLTASGADSYVWSNGATTASISVGLADVYSVTGTSDCGQGTALVTVTEITLNPVLSADITSGLAPLDVNFTDSTVPATATSSWVFGDGSTSTLTDPNHVFTTPGVYTVVLTATEQGCSGTATVVITVLAEAIDDSFVFVPNVFTPNGDQVNNVLRINSNGITSFNMLIYNRWGQLVQELTNAQQVWDSRSEAGEAVPDGIYFYVLNAEGTDGKMHDLKGSITVLR